VKRTAGSLFTSLVAILLAVSATAVAQQRSAPQPAPMGPPIDAPRDIPYPGVLTLDVDATDLDRRIMRIKQTIPITAGPQVLLYSRWISGAHSPVGPVYNFAGLTISGNGKPIAWSRDPADVYAYRLDVPAGVSRLDVDAQFLTPTETAQGGIAMTREMMRLNWYTVALYPAGYFTRRIDIDASIRLPVGWEFGTALDVASNTGNLAKFKTVSFETLIDSPLFAGKYFRKIDLDPGGRSRVTLNVMADDPEFLVTKQPMLDAHRELIRQADRLYGARHYDHYDFLLSLSDQLAGAGIEHQRSSDNGVTTKYFAGWDTAFVSRDLLAHEYTHSWNGKYRRPADLWTPNFNVPMRNSLLWVYEGQTQYWGQVLAARSGFLTKQQALDSLASTAATYDVRVARVWRNLQDTTNDPIIASRRAIPWRSWQRSEDYYQEGQLVWLEIDTLIRERSKGKRSLDHFARNFFGVNDGDWGQLTYTFEDIVAELNKVEPYDWAIYLRNRLNENASGAPLDGLARGGYKLVYIEKQGDYQKAQDARRKITDLTYSLGVTIDSKGKFTAVQWDGPIFKAGLIVGTELVAVNGAAFDADRMLAAVKATKDGGRMELLIRQNDTFRTVRIDYRDGARYPALERIAGTRAVLDEIFAPRKQ